MFETKDDKGNNGIGGGMMKWIGPEHTVTNYITVSSIDEYSSKIKKSDGKAKNRNSRYGIYCSVIG